MGPFLKLFLSFIILKFDTIVQADPIKEKSIGDFFYYPRRSRKRLDLRYSRMISAYQRT